MKKEVAQLKLGEIATILTGTKAVSLECQKSIQELVEKKHYSGVYVTCNIPYHSLIDMLAKRGIDTQSIFFIDMITMSVAGKAVDASNCYFVNAPDELQMIIETLTQVVQYRPHTRFFLLDSIATLAMYSKPERMRKFVHFITTALRTLQMEGILIAPKGTNHQILEWLESLSDYVIEK